jgi:hypothetical protein
LTNVRAGGDVVAVAGGVYVGHLTVRDADEAATVIEHLRALRPTETFRRPLRRLDPIVLVNRRDDLAAIERFFENSDYKVLFVVGMPGIGKSTIARGAIELRRPTTSIAWVQCEGLDTTQLLVEMSEWLGLPVGSILSDSAAPIATKISAVVGGLTKPGIVVLDGFEALLNSEGRYHSKNTEAFIDALTAYEHHAKVLATTRGLPTAVGAGSVAVQVHRVSGLPPADAEKLFHARAGPGASVAFKALPAHAFSRLNGHPKFIELLASAVGSLPVEQIGANLLAASDIGDYLIREVLSLLSTTELQVLKAASVFRDTFSFDALAATTAGAFGHQAVALLDSVTSLVRRAILDATGDANRSYYLHPLMREAASHDASEDAAVQSAAARWYLRVPFHAADIGTWGDGLYHLRRAAEIGRTEETFKVYADFIDKNREPLFRSGWVRRLIAEDQLMVELAPDRLNKLLWRWTLGRDFARLGHGYEEEALQVFRDVLAELEQSKEHFRTQIRAEGASDEDFEENHTGWVTLVKLTLARTIVDKAVRFSDDTNLRNDLAEAQRLSEEVGEPDEHSTDLQVQFDAIDLRFSLARVANDLAGMTRWADAGLRLAQAKQDAEGATEEGRWFAKSRLASAYFQSGVVAVRRLDLVEAVALFSAYLRINLDLGNNIAVVSGLFNVGALLAQVAEADGAALLLTGEQMDLEHDLPREEWETEVADTHVDALLANAEAINHAREIVRKLSPDLLPYFDRAVARRSAKNPRAQSPARPLDSQ